MITTYPATLRGGQIEWGSLGAPNLPADSVVQVEVKVLTSVPPATKSGAAMAAALEAIAARGGPQNFGDPSEWQREQRIDRPLVGREE